MDMAKLRPALSCLRFICQRRLASGGKDREKLKDEKIKAEVELKQLEIQRVKNEMVSAEWAQREMETGYREQAAKTASMFRSLPPLLAGRNVEDIARIMAEKKAELFADIAGMLPPEPDPKPKPKRKGGNRAKKK
jgi:DNA-directed RNA polymerase subunit F